jgi:hypothetical protein
MSTRQFLANRMVRGWLFEPVTFSSTAAANHHPRSTVGPAPRHKELPELLGCDSITCGAIVRLLAHLPRHQILGSGLLFFAMILTAAAITGGIVSVLSASALGESKLISSSKCER